MNVLFCKITPMKYYKGPLANDPPINSCKYGGKYVKENGMGHEAWNFLPVAEGDKTVCYGFVEPKSNRGIRNTLHIENITDDANDKFADFVDDVLVIWCATTDRNVTSVVGWYNHATVYRDIQDIDRDEEPSGYNVVALADDCILLPRNERDKHKWSAPVARIVGYGFGSAMTWYPILDGNEKIVTKILESIKNYSGTNWINVYNRDEE